LKAGPELRPRAQALEVLRKLAASSDANLGALRAAGALGALLALLAAAPPASGRAAGAVHLLRDLALYAPADRCALERLWAALRDESAISSTAAVHAQGPGMLWRGSPSVCALTLATAGVLSAARQGLVHRRTCSRPATHADTGWMHCTCSPSPHTSSMACAGMLQARV